MKTHSQLNKDILKEREFRYVSTPEVVIEKREDGTEVRLVKGTAVKFNELSRNLGWFREKFEPGAFNDVLQNDVVALFNHNIDKVLARTISKTLTLTQDEIGLHYQFEAPDNTAGNDLVVSMRRGDIQHSSFSFTVQDEMWEEDEEHGEVRTVLKVKRLYDVSPVVFPAYPQSVSELAKRSYDAWKEELSKPEEEARAIALETELLEAEHNLRKLIL